MPRWPSEAPAVRKCVQCGAQGGIEAFRRRRDAKTLDSWCRACQCKSQRGRSSPTRRLAPSVYSEYKKRNPQKAAAHRIVRNAIRRGEMQRLACQECGDPKAQAHHADYSKPLDVKWLCHKCHKKEHRKYV